MKQNYKYTRLLPKLLCLPALWLGLNATAQTGANVSNGNNTGTVSWGVGVSPNQFNVAGPYSATATAIDHFYDASGTGTPIDISGTTAPSFGNLVFSNGATSAANITNTAGIIVNTTAAFNNGITNTVRTNRAAGLLGAIQFLGTATYTPTLSPAAGPDARFVDGYVSKVDPASFVFPVGNVTAFRPITATGTGTFTAAWSNTNATTNYVGALPSGVKKTATNGYWEWNGSAIATATLSIPDVSTFTSAANLTVVGFDGAAWVNLGGVFATNTENSTNGTAISVPANIQAMVVAEIGVPLSLKVFLEGDMGAGATMHNTLQNYFGGNTGLLPNVSPYGGVTNSYAAINNPLGLASTVADWITVEVRVSPYTTVAETQYLLLKTDGTIVTPLGATPVFSAQSGTVRVVIKHRSHLAIMSNNIINFNSAKTYDFSTGLAQASNEGGDPAQMKLRNGVWTMLAGDLNSDNYIDGGDGSIMNVGINAGFFEQYLKTDINMDAFVDGADGSFANQNINTSYISTLANF